jgi:hypothetical protein
VPTSRVRVFVLLVPFAAISGIFLIGQEIGAHGLSRAVLAGLAGGVCVTCALGVVFITHWNPPYSARQKRATRRAWRQSRSGAVSLGVLGAGVVVAGTAAGHAAPGFGTFVQTAVGVVCLAAAAFLAVAAIRLPQLWR